MPASSPRDGSVPRSFDALAAQDALRTRRLRFAAAATVALGALLALVSPSRSPLSAVEARRFGYFGPTRLVSEIEVRRNQDRDSDPLAGEAGFETVAEVHTGGGPPIPATVPAAPAPATPRKPELDLAGESAQELRRLNLPVVQSEELVIDFLVKPTYPTRARLLGLEAIVELEALVDEEGRVRRTRIVTNTGQRMFAESAREAVLMCRFLPYRQDGRVTPVYARFRFNFKLVN